MYVTGFNKGYAAGMKQGLDEAGEVFMAARPRSAWTPEEIKHLAEKAQEIDRKHTTNADLTMAQLAKLLLVMACCALIAGLTGFVLARHGFLAEPDWIAPPLVSSSYPAFVADWCAHSASYASGFFGGLVLCILQYRKRVRIERLTPTSDVRQLD